MDEQERQRKMKLFWSAFGGAPDFMPGVTAETISEQRRQESEQRNRKLAKHWGYDPARLHHLDRLSPDGRAGGRTLA
jgi:hypothetical protein